MNEYVVGYLVGLALSGLIVNAWMFYGPTFSNWDQWRGPKRRELDIWASSPTTRHGKSRWWLGSLLVLGAAGLLLSTLPGM